MASVANLRDGDGGGGRPGTHTPTSLRPASTKITSFLTLKPPSPPRLSLKTHSNLLHHSFLSIEPPSDSPQAESLSSELEFGSVFPSGTRVSVPRGGGPVFVGRVFNIHEGPPTVLPKWTPGWVKKMFAAVTKSDRIRPVSHFFTHGLDVVSYLLTHFIPNDTLISTCGLDIAHEQFKEKPHLIQFVPNGRQVKEAKKLLKNGDGKKKFDGLPVFGSQNLDIVIASKDGTKRYTPYFLNKDMLDGLLERCTDRYFQTIIGRRRLKRWGIDLDGDITNTDEVVEEMGESIRHTPEVLDVWHEISDEMGHPGIPLNLLPKVAEIEILNAVDKVLLGNRWFRKATGIQPKFPYMVDSFEKKSSASFLRADKLSVKTSSEVDNSHEKQAQIPDFRFPFGDWVTLPWSKHWQKQQSLMDTRTQEEVNPLSPFLPMITIIDISMGEPETSNASFRKTTADLIEVVVQEFESGSTWTKSMVEERDPFFLANVESVTACLYSRVR